MLANKNNTACNRPQTVVRKQPVRAQEEKLRQPPKGNIDAIKDAAKAAVDPPKGPTVTVPQAQVLAPKAVPAVKKSIVMTKVQHVIRKQQVPVEGEQLRPARKRKMDVLEDATTDRPRKWSMAANGQKQTSPPQTKKPDTCASSLAKAKGSIEDVTAHTTEDAVADSDSISSAEAQAAFQASTTQQVDPAAIHVDASSSSADLEMPPTPGYAQEVNYDLFEPDFATRMAKATNEEDEDAPQSNEESTRALDSLFIEPSSDSGSLFEDNASDLDTALEERPNGSSKATSPDSQHAKTTSPGASLDRGQGEEGVRPRGIINRKHSCFAASVLQALLSIGPFTKFYKMFTDPSMMQLLRGLSIYMQNVNRWRAQNPHDLAVKGSRVAKIRETLRDHLKAHM